MLGCMKRGGVFMTKFYNNLGIKIKKIREKLDLSQEVLAKKWG